jgi:hypothetical protein
MAWLGGMAAVLENTTSNPKPWVETAAWMQPRWGEAAAVVQKGLIDRRGVFSVLTMPFRGR